ncbi:hypothetical protein JCM1840_001630 [Sporobolomyces johnsonii]
MPPKASPTPEHPPPASWLPFRPALSTLAPAPPTQQGSLGPSTPAAPSQDSPVNGPLSGNRLVASQSSSAPSAAGTPRLLPLAARAPAPPTTPAPAASSSSSPGTPAFARLVPCQPTPSAAFASSSTGAPPSARLIPRQPTPTVPRLQPSTPAAPVPAVAYPIPAATPLAIPQKRRNPAQLAGLALGPEEAAAATPEAFGRRGWVEEDSAWVAFRRALEEGRRGSIVMVGQDLWAVPAWDVQHNDISRHWHHFRVEQGEPWCSCNAHAIAHCTHLKLHQRDRTFFAPPLDEEGHPRHLPLEPAITLVLVHAHGECLHFSLRKGNSASSATRKRVVVIQAITGEWRCSGCSGSSGRRACEHIERAKDYAVEAGELDGTERDGAPQVDPDAARAAQEEDEEEGPRDSAVSFVPRGPPLAFRFGGLGTDHSPPDICTRDARHPAYPCADAPPPVLPLEATSKGRCGQCSLDWGNCQDSLVKNEVDYTVYYEHKAYEVKLEVARCPRCPFGAFIGPYLIEHGLFNLNNHIGFTRNLLDSFTAHFTASETPFAAFCDAAAQVYAKRDSAFCRTRTFRAAWYAYARLLQIGTGMSCPHPDCGSQPCIVIADGTVTTTAKRFATGQLRPPTCTFDGTGIHSEVRAIPMPCLVSGDLGLADARAARALRKQLAAFAAQRVPLNELPLALQAELDKISIGSELGRALLVFLELYQQQQAGEISSDDMILQVFPPVASDQLLPPIGDLSDVFRTGVLAGGKQLRYRPTYPKLYKDGGEHSTSDSACRKYYSEYGKSGLTGGICGLWCPHGICVAYHTMPTAEGRNDVFSALLCFWETAREVVVYDYACQLAQYAMVREPEFFRNTSFQLTQLPTKATRDRSRSRSRSQTPDVRPPAPPRPVPPPPPRHASATSPTPPARPCSGYKLRQPKEKEFIPLLLSWLLPGGCPGKLVIDTDAHLFSRICIGTLRPLSNQPCCMECFKLSGLSSVLLCQAGIERDTSRIKRETLLLQEEMEKYERLVQRRDEDRMKIWNLEATLKQRDDEIAAAWSVCKAAANSRHPRLGMVFELASGASFKILAREIQAIIDGKRRLFSFTDFDYEIGLLVCVYASNTLACALNKLGLIPSPASVRRRYNKDKIIPSPSAPEPFELLHNLNVQFNSSILPAPANPHALYTLMQDEVAVSPRFELHRATYRVVGIDATHAGVLDVTASEEALEHLKEAASEGRCELAKKLSVSALALLDRAAAVTSIVPVSSSVAIPLSEGVRRLHSEKAIVEFFLKENQLGRLHSLAMDGDARGRAAMQELLNGRDLRDELRPEEAARLEGAFAFDYACGPGAVVQTHDLRHIIKRIEGRCENDSRGIELDGVHIFPAHLASLFRERFNTYSDDYLTHLLNPKDKMNVAHASNFQHHLSALISPVAPPSAFPASTDVDGVTLGQRRLVAYLGYSFGLIGKAIGDPDLDLGEQHQLLVTANFLIWWAYQADGTAFTTSENVHDFGCFVKEVEVAIAKSRPTDELFLGDFRSDRLEEHFSHQRGRLNIVDDFTTIKFADNGPKIRQGQQVLEKHNLAHSSARRRLTPAWDHVNPEQITGDSTVKTVGNLSENHNQALLHAIRIANDLNFSSIVPADAVQAAQGLQFSLRPPHDHPLFYPRRSTGNSRPDSLLARAGKVVRASSFQGLTDEVPLQPPSSDDLQSVLATVTTAPSLAQLTSAFRNPRPSPAHAITLLQVKGFYTLAVIRVLDLHTGPTRLNRLTLAFPFSIPVQIRAQVLRLTPLNSPTSSPTEPSREFWLAMETVETFKRQNSSITFDGRLVALLPSHPAAFPSHEHGGMTSSDGRARAFAGEDMDRFFDGLIQQLSTLSSPSPVVPAIPSPSAYFPYFREDEDSDRWSHQISP